MRHICQSQKHTVELQAIFPGGVAKDSDPLALNGPILVTTGILKTVVVSAAKAQLGALFSTAGKQRSFVWHYVEDMGHCQPSVPVNCDNSTIAGIANDSLKNTGRIR